VKWALTADLQFNTQPRYSVLRPDGTTSRLQDTVDAFLWIAQTAREKKCKGLVALGDIFDSRTSIDVSVLDKTCRAFEAASDGLEVHVLVGNHDSYLRTPSLNSLQALRGFATVHEKVEAHGPFAFVPWTDDAARYADAIKRAEKFKPPVMLSHAMFEGAVPLAGKGLPIKLLSAKRWEAVFLGDVHDPVTLREAPLVQYCGAPLQINFGDAGGERGFWIYDDVSGEVEFIENDVSPRFHVAKTMADFDDAHMVTDRDFVRIKAETSKLTEKLREEFGAYTTWIESEATADEFVKPRLDVAVGMGDEDLIRKFCKHMGVDSEVLIELGVEILSEARAC
jgi:DNA repair exonuclease SbcCD nuclease subunit